MTADRGLEGQQPRDPGNFECVEPAIGDRLWRLDDPAAPAGEIELLEAHLSICHACRLLRAVDARLERALRHPDAAVATPAARRPGRGYQALPEFAGRAAALLAACLALVLIVPPRQQAPDTRGADDWGIVRPVPGEVVPTTTPRIAWEPLPAARAYRVTVTNGEDGFFWQVETEKLEVRVPDEANLPRPGLFQITVQPLPAYLAPPAGSSTWLRTDSILAFVGFRLAAAPRWILWLGLLLAGVLAAFGVHRIRHRR